MAPKPIRRALKDMLANLSMEDFEDFCHELVNRRGEQQVSLSRVEGKSRLDIVQVLVSTFTESGALHVAVEILRENNCGDAVEELLSCTGGQSSKPGSSETGATGVQTKADNGCTDGEHFVDKHRTQLINRVCSIPEILDELLEKKVIQPGDYEEIMALPTSQGQMRKLYSGPLNAAGLEGKDVFYKILEKKQPYLMNELKKN
ncbi:apoptosis-associated speck-like protein containing a CARD [Cottoperca gobio]|uniref:Apoptosis-associated speck-like protein containing a CARD n=1 Tax=Cottoperca gobio TaxID=56716 RepID=A0A6J2RDW0_COTGO|nr:apoptosis-associated speck-like protein containing a CARD [Cottoperca gobio]XP_029308355.1 apoptosis-associated speck-like protein containing a CARD [Cottoperca gobio]